MEIGCKGNPRKHTPCPHSFQKPLKPTSIQEVFDGFLRVLSLLDVNCIPWMPNPNPTTRFLPHTSLIVKCVSSASEKELSFRSGWIKSHRRLCNMEEVDAADGDTVVELLSTNPKGANGCWASLHRLGEVRILISCFSAGRVTLLSFTCSLHSPSVRSPGSPKDWANPAASRPPGLPT